MDYSDYLSDPENNIITFRVTISKKKKNSKEIWQIKNGELHLNVDYSDYLRVRKRIKFFFREPLT